MFFLSENRLANQECAFPTSLRLRMCSSRRTRHMIQVCRELVVVLTFVAMEEREEALLVLFSAGRVFRKRIIFLSLHASTPDKKKNPVLWLLQVRALKELGPERVVVVAMPLQSFTSRIVDSVYLLFVYT